MGDQNQMEKNTLGLTKREIHEESLHLEDFWRHQLDRIKEVAEDEQAPKEDASGTLKSTRMNMRFRRTVSRIDK
jgi:hypothetical protein